jgi:hypothetical protein
MMALAKLLPYRLRGLQNFDEIFFLPKFRYKAVYCSSNFTGLNPRCTHLHLNPVYCLWDLTSACIFPNLNNPDLLPRKI